MTFTHLPPLLLGCAPGFHLATSPEGWFARLLRSQLVAWIGLAGMVMISVVWGNNRAWLDQGGYAVYGVFSCLLIGHLFVAAARPGAISRVLSWKPLVVMGQVSYEAYLVHCIVILGVLHLFPTMGAYPMIGLDVALICVISGGFYYFIGQPIRREGWGTLVRRRAAPTSPQVPPPRVELAA